MVIVLSPLFLFTVILFVLSHSGTDAFERYSTVTKFMQQQTILQKNNRNAQLNSKKTSKLFALDDSNEDGYTQKQILKEETEAPFRTVRIYGYIALLAAASLGSLVSFTKVLSMGGSGQDMTEAYSNLAINLVGIPILGLLWKRDLDSRKSILDRIQKGGSLAGLKVKTIVDGEPLIVKLSDLRRDRGIEKRVIIVAAEEDLLKSSLQTSVNQSGSLVQNDLLIVPLIVEKPLASSSTEYTLSAPINMQSFVASGDEAAVRASASSKDEPAAAAAAAADAAAVQHIGVPMAVPQWNNVIKKEFSVALKQQPDALSKGITIIIKKNGKVGSRRFGVPIWESLVDDVQMRANAGLDVRNI